VEKTGVNKDIEAFISRLGEDFSITEMRGVKPDTLAGFNAEAYSGEFNSARFADRKKILRLWKWKYNDNPASKNNENFGWLAKFKEKLIGQWHIIPADIKIGENYYRGAWGSDLVVLNEYRNLGISAFLIRRVSEALGRDFALFLLGGMNENSYRVLKSSGSFIDLGKIPRYVKILNLKAVLIAYGIPPFFAGAAQKIFHVATKILFSSRKSYGDAAIKIESVNTFDEGFEDFWNSISGYYKCIVKRDPAILKWRYIDQPLWKYTVLKVSAGEKITAFAVLREGKVKNGKLKGNPIGIISDILVDPQHGECTRRLLQEVVKFFTAKNVIIIKCDVLNDNIENNLRKTGFVRIKSNSGFMLGLYRHKMSGEDSDYATTRKNWFITSGDSDFDFD